MFHFLPHCKTLWPWMHLLRELLLPFELPLPELDTLSDLLIDFLVGSNSRSNIWRMVLCLRLNGLVYILLSLRPLSFEMEILFGSAFCDRLYSKENVLLIAFQTRYHFFFFQYSNFNYMFHRENIYIYMYYMLIECSRLTLHRSNLARMIAKRHLPALYMHNIRYPSVEFGQDRLEAL